MSRSLVLDDSPGKLSDLAEEIRSKERALALLDEALPGDPASKQILGQLQLRDRKIEELTTRVQEAEMQLAAASLESQGAKERTLAQLQDERSQLLKELQGLEEHSSALESQLHSTQRELSDLKENSELLQEGLTEELEQARSTAVHRDEALRAAKQDIAQLSKIVAEMSKLNSDLNDKILTQNAQVEKLNARYYEANIKALHAEELEVMYNDLRAQYQKSADKNKKLNEENARLRTLEEASRVCQEKLRTVEDSLSSAFDSGPLLEVVQSVRHDLKSSTTLKKAEDTALLKQEASELRDQVKDLQRQSQKLTANESAYLERIKFLESEKTEMKQPLEEAIDRLQRRLKVIQDSHDRYKARCDQLEQSLSQSELALQRANNQVAALQSQVGMLKTNRREVAQVETKLQATVRDLRTTVAQLKTQRATQESSLTAREQRLKATALHMKILADDVWKRDTEIMKLKKTIDKLENQLALRKSAEQATHAHAKSKLAEEMTNVNGQLEEKDREIGILRDMIRGMQQQIKTKDAELGRLKRKYESDPVREMPVAASPEPALPKLAQKIDSSVKEIEDLLSLKAKLATDAKPPQTLVKRLLRVDPVPKDKMQVLAETMRRLEEAMENFHRFATAKSAFVITSEHLAGSGTSTLLQEMMQSQAAVSISDVLSRVKSLS